MNILAIITRIRLEIQALIETDDGRQHVIGRVAEYFDAIAKVIAIPGPDAWAKGLLLLIVGLIYDAIASADAKEDPTVWDGLPDAPATLYVPEESP